jgi:prolyl oligopeptidase
MAPGYMVQALSWVQAGGVFALAGLRGGGEEGAAWHRAGRREHKQRVFDDFDAAAATLVDEGWTTPGQLGILGSSNGGLLVGAALTQHPERYGAAVAISPLLDMLRYERSGLGPSWREEYGSAADPVMAAHLRAYSPYHRVRPATPSPATMFAVFDGDTRVDPGHARKTAARLAAATSSGRPVLLRVERGSGHGSRSQSRVEELLADVLAFFAHELGR